MRIEFSKRSGNQYVKSLIIDGEVIREVYNSLIKKEMRNITKLESKEEVLAHIEEHEPASALKYALWALSKRGHFIHELTEKLIMRAFSGEIIDEVITKCLGWEYLDDTAELDRAILRLKARGEGPRLIVQKVKMASNLPDTVLNEALGRLFSFEEEEKMIKHLLETKCRTKPRDKAYAYLMRKGFNVKASHLPCS